MTDDSALLRLPTVAKNHILYFCDYLEIARLRKVCHTLRNHIDKNKPDAHVKDVCLGYQNADIYFESDNDSRIWINYKEAESGCTVECISDMGDHPVKPISGLDPMGALIQDFKIYLKHLKSPLRKFKLDKVCCDALLQIMRSQPPESGFFPLNVDKLELHRLSPAQILATLPLFNANRLKYLKIEADMNAVTDRDGLNGHALFETAHWRNAEKVNLYPNFKIPNVRQIFHLKRFEGSISRVTAADVDFLKNTFISSPLFERCRIIVDVDIDLLSLMETFVAPSFEIINVNQWYFHIPNDSRIVLLVEVICKRILEIKRTNRRNVKSGAVIIY